MFMVFHTNVYWDISDLRKHCLTLERVVCFPAVWYIEPFNEGFLLAGDASTYAGE